MKQSIFQRSISGTSVGLLAFGFTLGTNLLQVTLLLSVWTQEQYGHWLLLLSAASMATALDGGHQLYIGNQLNREQVEDRKRMLVTLGSAVRVAALLALLQISILALLVASGWIYPLLGLDPESAPGFSLGLISYTVLWILTGSIGSILVRLFIPAGFYVRSIWWNLAMRATQFAVLVYTARLGWNLTDVAISFGLSTLTVSIGVCWDLKRLLPEFWPWWRFGSLKVGLANLARSSVYTFTSLLDTMGQQGMLILITHGLGAPAVPVFTTLRTVANMAMQGGSFLLNPVIPDIVRFHVTEQQAKLVGLFRFYWLALTFSMNLGLILVFAWLEPLYGLWTKGKLAFDIHLFLWLAIAVLFRSLGLPFVILLQSLNRLQVQVTLSLIRVLICVVGGIALLRPFGLSGVALAIAVSELVGSLLVPCWFVLKELKGLPFRQLGMGWAVVGTGAACALLGLRALDFINSAQLSLLGFVVLAACAHQQWRRTDADLRHRLLALLPAPLRNLLPAA